MLKQYIHTQYKQRYMFMPFLTTMLTQIDPILHRRVVAHEKHSGANIVYTEQKMKHIFRRET